MSKRTATKSNKRNMEGGTVKIEDSPSKFKPTTLSCLPRKKAKKRSKENCNLFIPYVCIGSYIMVIFFLNEDETKDCFVLMLWKFIYKGSMIDNHAFPSIDAKLQTIINGSLYAFHRRNMDKGDYADNEILLDSSSGEYKRKAIVIASNEPITESVIKKNCFILLQVRFIDCDWKFDILYCFTN